jgi:hypothetical protein
MSSVNRPTLKTRAYDGTEDVGAHGAARRLASFARGRVWIFFWKS